MTRALAVLVGGLLVAARAGAQGVVGAQGVGYPMGSVSARAAGTAGAMADFDAASATNPAAMASLPGAMFVFTSAPEWRTTEAGGASDATSVIRFPLFAGVTRVRQRWAAGLHLSTLLDRTWTTVADRYIRFGTDSALARDAYRSDGAVNDVRAAVAFRPRSWLAVGAAVHLHPGENRVGAAQQFPDSSTFGGFTQSSRVSYGGSSYSGGVELGVGRHWALAAHAKLGTEARLTLDDTLRATADWPNRVGASARYSGIAGATLVARWERVAWSSLQGIVRSTQARDADELGLGFEALGPRVFGTDSFLRLGWRTRGLPFDANSEAVSERTFAGGVGLPLARGRTLIDLGVQRDARDAGAATERAWRVTLGVVLRP